MTLLNSEDLRSLLGASHRPCVSLYMPTHRAGVETQQNPIRLKNLLRQTEEELESNGAPRGAADELLRPVRRLIDDYGFWQHQSDGLALFLAPELFQSYRLPLAFDELAVVGERFHCAPLLPLLSGDGRFHILALSQKRVRLYEATRHNIRELDLHDIPESLTQALGYDYEQRSLLFHSATGALAAPSASAPGRSSIGPAVHTAGRSRSMFHGHGAGEQEAHQEEIVRFLQIVDQGLTRLLRRGNEPLVVAAVDYEVAMFRDLSKHPRLMPEGVEGSPEGLTPDELRQRAWQVVEPYFQREQQAAARRFEELVGAGRTRDHLDEVLPVAAEGRVDTLFLPRGARRWGHFDPESGDVAVHERREAEDEDLFDRAALETLLHSGMVFAVAADEIPGNGEVAALLRY